MQVSPQFDIAVLGAGIAGLSAAISGALEGFSVILLERGESPPDRPGETLHPGCGVVFRKFGVEAEVIALATARHLGVVTKGSYGEERQDYGADNDGVWRGFQLPREALHSLMLRRVKILGSKIMFRTAARKLILEKPHQVLIRTDHEDFSASWLIDATGNSHWSARQLRKGGIHLSMPLTVTYGYDPNVFAQVDIDWPVMEVSPEGWSWQANLGDGRIAWVKLHKRSHHRNLPKGLAGKTLDATWKYFPLPASRVFQVGDAAGHLDPSVGHGVLRGMISAAMAIHFIKAAKDKRTSEHRIASDYDAWIKAWLYRDTVEIMHRLRWQHQWTR